MVQEVSKPCVRPKKKDVYIYITESLYCSAEVNTILSINSNKKKKIRKKKKRRQFYSNKKGKKKRTMCL